VGGRADRKRDVLQTRAGAAYYSRSRCQFVVFRIGHDSASLPLALGKIYTNNGFIAFRVSTAMSASTGIRLSATKGKTIKSDGIN
jgi:deoxyxylulose-5-phosphate synthase